MSTAAAPVRTSNDEALEIARDAYIYAYPMVVMEVTRRVGTNVAEPTGINAPVNQFAHVRAFPDPSMTMVVRPNADTLYSSLQYDVGREPLIIGVPDSHERYYLLEVMDYWTDVFMSPGKRTTGTGRLTFALVASGWRGELPPGVVGYQSPTACGWIIGRTQTNGKGDYAAVHAFQDGITAVPLSSYGNAYTAPKGAANANQDMSAPPDQVEKMRAADFFSMFAELLKTNPPHANDYPMLDQMKRIGFEPGKSFALASAPKAIQDALDAAPSAGLAKIKAATTKSGNAVNGWRINVTAIGTYGADYLHRAAVALAGLGANTIEDAVYPFAFVDADGKPFSGDERYQIHFQKDQLPPVRAFWSLTMYDDRQLFTENSIGRYAIGDRDDLAFNADGSLDLYIQRESPGKDQQSNWLPAPKSGGFTMNMRLYWPKDVVRDGSWAPPPVKKL
ncbi:MAG TPA: DUF1254 domain-containing protein [Candidatus Acidoferrum sp.]|nr:DUF1254 domain-containing protein [Candidatus Acidoferrum sp.]